MLLLSAWMQYAGTARSLPENGAYALIIIGQVRVHPRTPFPPFPLHPFLQALSSFTGSVYQILAPKYSERWFDLKSRTTATMIITIGGQYLSETECLFVYLDACYSKSHWSRGRTALIADVFEYAHVGAYTSYHPGGHADMK